MRVTKETTISHTCKGPVANAIRSAQSRQHASTDPTEYTPNHIRPLLETSQKNGGADRKCYTFPVLILDKPQRLESGTMFDEARMGWRRERQDECDNFQALQPLGDMEVFELTCFS